MRRSKARVPVVDAGLLVKDAATLLPNPSRRMFLRSASLGSLALLTGCDIIDGPSAKKALRVVSQFNDWVQARLFIRTGWRRPIPKAQSHVPSGSTPIVQKRWRPTSTRMLTSSLSTAWSRTSTRGRLTSSTRCRRRRRSPNSFASRVGARSAMDRNATARIPTPHRRRYAGKVRPLCLRRGLLGVDRYADGPASADADDLAFNRERQNSPVSYAVCAVL
jgi:hypothetical protein